MKTSMKFLSAVAVLLFGLAAAQAQPGSWNMTPEELAARQTEDMTTELGLNGEQGTKVSEINLKYAKKMAEVRAGLSDRSQMREVMMAINEEKNEELKEILSAEQFTKWGEIQQARMQQRAQWQQQGQQQQGQEKSKEKKKKKEKNNN